MARELEYRKMQTIKPGEKYLIGLFVVGTDSCVMVYDGYLKGWSSDVMALYPKRYGDAVLRTEKVPGKHRVSIFAIKD